MAHFLHHSLCAPPCPGYVQHDLLQLFLVEPTRHHHESSSSRGRVELACTSPWCTRYLGDKTPYTARAAQESKKTWQLEPQKD